MLVIPLLFSTGLERPPTSEGPFQSLEAPHYEICMYASLDINTEELSMSKRRLT
jgi:hypothetical protein